ncbi:periplasmic binding protein-like II [Exidia glandulosa HHB12029]|uniref:Periplasmic binding protein-like II n=1 Tax=Exidia glandulosa HHB12029 TaxID=1314781 RepID=A0A165PYM9_EXIGL|nr:periplasmic binding protein-like II [Exidia glandulosa HHB12029]
MAPLRIGYVHEHFSSPLLQFADDDKGKTFTLTECPGGTGQLTAAISNDEIDVAIALTDALIAGIAKGTAQYNLVGSYVSSSLNWAVIVGKDSKYNSIADLRGTTIGISRPGSGSQTMASVMAMQQGWVDPATGAPEELSFKVNGDINGLIKSVNDGSTSAFMWEWFTTKPRLDAGEVRFIGSVPTPWPSWLIAAHPTRASPEALRHFVSSLTTYVRAFDPRTEIDTKVQFIKERFHQKEDDIKEWLKTVKYPKDCTAIDGKTLVNTLSILEKAGVVIRPKEGFNIETFVNQSVVRLLPDDKPFSF